MEPAKIDWKKVEWVFVEDPAYEHFNAPKWIDLSSPYLHLHTDAHDDSWFCTPECKHPKTAEDFFKSTPTSTSASTSSSSRSQLRRPAKIYEILPLGERSPGDVIFKRKGATQSRVPLTKSPQNKSHEDSENQNPNLSTPLNPRCIAKCIIKSSAEKTQATDDASQTNSLPRLRSTLSARNLFAGRDILNQISEFCSELKKMATRTKEKENVETQNLVKDVEAQPNEAFGGEGKEWKPLLGVSAEKSNSMNKNDIKENQSRNENTREADNVPVNLELENARNREKNLLQIRTSPPSPQLFSATHEPTKTTPQKANKSRFTERQILAEVKPNKAAVTEESAEKAQSVSIAEGRDARALDVFWFLKPCTLSS